MPGCMAGPIAGLLHKPPADLELSGREEFHGIKRRDDLAPHDQLLEVIAIAQRFISEDPRPKVAWQRVGGFPIDRQSRIKHGDFLSNGRASALSLLLIATRKVEMNFWGGRRDSNPQQPESQSGALPLSYGHRRVANLDFRRWIAKLKREKVARRALYNYTQGLSGVASQPHMTILRCFKA
jgi:hypothetical protein